MKRRILVAAIFLTALSASFNAAQEPVSRPGDKADGAIRGIVTRSGTGEPIANARVTLLPLKSPENVTPDSFKGGVGVVCSNGGGSADSSEPPAPTGPSTPAVAAQPAPPPSPIPSIDTDGSGRFAFKNLTAGAYRLWIAANGYLGEQCGQAITDQRSLLVSEVLHLLRHGTINPQNKQFTLAERETLDLTIALTPTGSLSGRVLDRFGHPLSGVNVTLFKKTYDSTGHAAVGKMLGAARTDDQGAYRIFWITPGRYYLKAGGEPGKIDPGSNEAAPVPSAAMFYPSEKSFSDAASIEVRAGANLENLNFALEPERFYRIRGRVVDTRTGKPPAGLHAGDVSYDYNPVTGEFEIRNVRPGNYVVRAMEESPGGGWSTGWGDSSRMGTLTVTDTDVDGILLSLGPPESVSISGHVRGDAQLPSSGVEVKLAPEGITGHIRSATTAAEGSFTAKVPDDALAYAVSIAGLPDGWYLKEARFGDMDALKPIRFSGSATLEILLSSKAGRVTGSVKDAGGSAKRPLPSAKAVLVPDARNRTELFQTVDLKPDGGFVFSNVPPGDYKLYVWEDIAPWEWFDPGVLKASESMATPVHVAESSRETVNVDIIPSGAQE